MSMNLHLKLTLLDSKQEVQLYQTPTNIANANMTNEQFREAYIGFIRYIISTTDNQEEKCELEEHIRGINFYCTHALHKWEWY